MAGIADKVFEDLYQKILDKEREKCRHNYEPVVNAHKRVEDKLDLLIQALIKLINEEEHQRNRIINEEI